jgi:uncharacterized protein (TIGR02246 family)
VTDHETIVEMFDRYREAVHAKDVDAFTALFDDDVHVFDMWGRWSYNGLDEWRQMATEWFSSLGSDTAAVEFDDVQTIVGDGVAAAHAFVTFRGLSAAGDELRSMNNRLTWALRKTDRGEWKVVHEHSSAPIDFETAKVILNRS